MQLSESVPMTMNNFYQVLSIDRQATSREIQERFRVLVRERHPDIYDGDEKEKAEHDFQAITEAFNALRDPKRRGEHDAELDRPTGSSTDPKALAKLYMNRGIRAYKADNNIEAADNFDRATKAEPSNSQAWHHLALTCIREKRWLPKAEEAIEQALALRAKHIPYVKLAARIYLEAGVTPKAKEYYNQLILLGGSDATTRKALEAKLGPPRRKAESTAEGGLLGKIW
jgi:tetratricopeptide (TPR) repeat protein